jgi:hypothetical protein
VNVTELPRWQRKIWAVLIIFNIMVGVGAALGLQYGLVSPWQLIAGCVVGAITVPGTLEILGL